MSPTYKNINKTRKPVGTRVIEPGEQFISLTHLNENETELLKIDEKPYYNPILVSELVTTNKTIIIPGCDKYSIHFYVEKGEVEINYDSPDNKPTLKLYSGARWNSRFFDRRVNKIFIRGTDFRVWTIIERN